MGNSIIFHARSNSELYDLQFIIVSSFTGRIVSQKQLNAKSRRLVTFDIRATTELMPKAQAYIWQVNDKGQVIYASCQIEVKINTKQVS